MKIAVLIYGRLNNCIKHYKNIVNSIGKENDIDFFLSSDNSNENIITDFIDLYNPISYINDKIEYTCNLDKYDGKRGETNIHNMTCHFINKYRVFTLLEKYIEEKNIKYDIIISLRVDILIENKFIFDNIKDNTIYIPQGNDFIDNALNDQIAYGNLIVMKKYMNIFNNCELLLNQKLSIPHPESLTLANINFYNLDIFRVNLKYKLIKN